MKAGCLILAVMGWLVLAGCASASKTAHLPVQLGMTRDELKQNFGVPLRIEAVPGGGENWYYHFTSWKSRPVSGAETSNDAGVPTTTVSAGLSFWKDTVDRPVHVSADGEVIGPLPEGKIVKN